MNYTNLFKYNFLQSDLNIHFEELSIFPEYDNLSCLGQIKIDNENQIIFYTQKNIRYKNFYLYEIKKCYTS